jgi:hypothetical protein
MKKTIKIIDDIVCMIPAIYIIIDCGIRVSKSEYTSIRSAFYGNLFDCIKDFFVKYWYLILIYCIINFILSKTINKEEE